MAQVLSTRLTNATSVPRVVNARMAGYLVSDADTVEVPDNANADSVVLGIKLHVDSHIRSVRVASDDLGSAGVMDVGVAVKDSIMATTFTAVSGAVDIFGANLDVNAAAVAFTERRWTAEINNVNKTLWELAGLSAKPSYDYMYIILTFDTGTTTAGTVSAIVDYVTP